MSCEKIVNRIKYLEDCYVNSNNEIFNNIIKREIYYYKSKLNKGCVYTSECNEDSEMSNIRDEYGRIIVDIFNN